MVAVYGPVGGDVLLVLDTHIHVYFVPRVFVSGNFGSKVSHME